MVKKTFWTAAVLGMAPLLLLPACTGMSSGLEPQAASPSEEFVVDNRETGGQGAGQETDQVTERKADAGQVPEAEAAFAYLLVNKQHRLPDGYKPDDLVYPDVRFIFTEKMEKRMLRKPAAEALEQLFAAARKDGAPLAGVSAYRSHRRQEQVFHYYVRRDGEAAALTFSAYPGTSEHETGLAIDVSGANGRCAASDCFAATREARWLARHAHEYGYIVRYPEGKEALTGYKYEPWHLRYVGPTAAKYIHMKGITLEEYEEAASVSGSDRRN